MRARNTLEQCNRYSLLDGPDVLEQEPRPADPALLTLFHDETYLDVLEQASVGEINLALLEHGIGTEDCPALPGIYEFSLLATGATLMGVEMVLDGKAQRAFNLVGGFHHAYRDHAEGFCYINDVGVALATLLERGLRVAFVDIDAHHCNGVQDAFYRDDRVLVISLHESGKTLYPWGGSETELGEGPGRGFNVNVPLLERTDDDLYVETFRKVVPPLLAAFGPDLVLAEIGADTILSDPLTHLRLTNNGYRTVVEELCELSPRLVAVGGGGYDVFRTARCWALAWAAMSGNEPEDAFAGMVGGMMFGGAMGGLYDRPMPTLGEAKERARADADRVVAFIWKNIFPLLGAVAP